MRLLQRDVANLPPEAVHQLTQAHHTLCEYCTIYLGAAHKLRHINFENVDVSVTNANIWSLCYKMADPTKMYDVIYGYSHKATVQTSAKYISIIATRKIFEGTCF